MTALPAEVEFGKVVGRFLLAASDGVDVDTEPDAVPGVGTIKFVPLTPNQRVLEPEPVTVTHRGLICNLNSTGHLVDAMSSPGVWLAAGAWEVTFSIKNVRISPLTIVVTAEHTELEPLDLAVAIPPEGPPINVGQYAELSDRIENIEIAAAGDHGALLGLGDDDHPQYAKTDGTRGAFATVAQGILAASAVQPSGLAATLTGYATAAQGAKADTAVQPAGLAATLTGYATAVQGAKADTAVQPAALSAYAPLAHNQAAATITDLTEAVQDIVGSFLVAGTNVTVSYDDVANTFTINASGGGGGTDAEIVRDTIAAAMVGGSGIQITIDDASDTITIASTAVLPTRQVIAGTGLTGGGDLSANRTLAVSYGTAAGTAAQGNDSRITGAVQNTRQVIAGTGLTGGGTLAADRTVAVSYGTVEGTAAQGNDSRITGAAQKSANLSDLANAGTARTNLGLGSAATTPSTNYATAAQGATADAALAAAAAPELIRDTMATALVAGANVTITPNDGADTITIAAAGGGGGGSPAFLLPSLPGGATRPPFDYSATPNNTGYAYGTSYPWPAGVPFAGIAFKVTVAQAGATMNVGVYDCDEIGQPKTRLNLTTGIDVSTTGHKTVAFSATPTGGLLWVFFKCSTDGAVVRLDGYSNNATSAFIAVSTSNWEAQRACKIDPSLPADAAATFSVDSDWWVQPGFHIIFPT